MLFTGAASGMGRASAPRFGREGAQVWCADINGETDDVANMMCCVASEEAKFINGAILSVDGGAMAG